MPSGTVVTAQTRSRQSSLLEAMKTMQERVDLETQTVHNGSIASNRKQQVGSGMRGDKIRTYRFQDDVVKDHVTERTASVKKVLSGNFDLLWNINEN